MRFFIALEPGRDLLESVLKNTALLREKYPGFRWMPPENLHITLAFLGETDAGLLPQIKQAAETAVKFSGQGVIHAGGGKLFTLPRGKTANVLALGFESGKERIASLAGNIRKNLEIRGIIIKGKDRNFTPHITLARKGRTVPRPGNEDSCISFRGDIMSLGVYESRLSAGGAEYMQLAVYPLDSCFSTI